MALNDLYEVVDVQELQGKQILNVYYYKNSNIASNADELAELWVDQVLPSILVLQVSDLVHTEVRVRNLFSAADVASILVNEAGITPTDGRDALPAFDAYSFTLYGATSVTRPGGKRIAGLTESEQVDGALVSGILSAVADVADVLSAVLLGSGGTQRFQPVIVKRVKEVVDGVTQYRLPENISEAVSQLIVEAVWSLFVSSQVSRKD